MTSRSAFSALELLIAIGLMMILAGMSVFGVFDQLRSSTLQQATSHVEQVVETARALARSANEAALGGIRPLDPTKQYGVVFVDDRALGISWVAVTYGTQADATSVLMGPDGNPVKRFELPGTMAFFADSPTGTWDRLSGRNDTGAVGIQFRYGLGTPSVSAAVDPRPVFFGMQAASITQAKVQGAQVIRSRFAIGSIDRTRSVSISMDACGRWSAKQVELGK